MWNVVSPHLELMIGYGAPGIAMRLLLSIGRQLFKARTCDEVESKNRHVHSNQPKYGAWSFQHTVVWSDPSKRRWFPKEWVCRRRNVMRALRDYHIRYCCAAIFCSFSLALIHRYYCRPAIITLGWLYPERVITTLLSASEIPSRNGI
jgi:hypothetical protein